MVKGAATATRFIDNGDGTIKDTENGLIWVKNPHTDLPAKFKGCMVWKNAIQECKDLDFADKKDWRLPTVEELRELVDYTRGKGDELAVDTKFFPDTKFDWYWTITQIACNSGSAWCVHFGYGSVVAYNEDGYYFVRPVRSSQC